MKYPSVITLRFKSDAARDEFYGQFLDGWGEGLEEISTHLPHNPTEKYNLCVDVFDPVTSEEIE